MKKELKTIQGNSLTIESQNESTVSHFGNPRNYTDIIIEQMNTKNMYQNIIPNKSDLVVVDIGANVGLFSLHVSDRAKSVYSIEPTPSHFSILKELTQGKDNILPVHCALSNTDEEVTLYISEQNSTMNSIVNKYGQEVKVKGVKISSLLKMLSLNHVDFIKCDIEGSEIVALTEETVSEVKDKVDVWFIEAHATDGNGIGRNRWRLREVFEKNGYKVTDYEHDGLVVTK